MVTDKTGPYGNSAEDTGITHPRGGLVQTAVQKPGLPPLREKLRVSNYTSHTPIYNSMGAEPCLLLHTVTLCSFLSKCYFC